MLKCLLFWCALFLASCSASTPISTDLYNLRQGLDTILLCTESIHTIVSSGSLVCTRSTIFTDPSCVNAYDSEGLTPLHHAAQKGYTDIGKVLLENGAQANSFDKIQRYQATPLHHATYFDNEAFAKMLLTYGANVNARAAQGITPLHVAASKGHAAIARVLITNGANVNARTDNNRITPLHYAVRHHHTDVIKLLAQKGANPNIQGKKNGRTPAHIALEAIDEKAIKALSRNTHIPIDTTLKDADGTSIRRIAKLKKDGARLLEILEG